jgi:hypothetical protein
MLATNLICWLVLWPALVLTFGPARSARRPAPAPRIRRRSWAAAAVLPGRRVVAVRLQVVYT